MVTQNYGHIKGMQINLDREKAATLLAERKFKDGFDIALVQEPYIRFSQTEQLFRHKADGECKVEVWTKTHLRATTVIELTTANYVTVRLTGHDNELITSIYEEPGGQACPRLGEMSIKLNNMHNRHLIGADFNAHNVAWGRDETDARGVKLLTWCNARGYLVCNREDQGPF